LLAAVASTHAGVATAQDPPAQWALSVGASALHFEYREYADDGTRLLLESGMLPGVVAVLGRTVGRWQGEVELAVHGGAVDYQGRTQSGAPFATRTDSDIWQARLGVMRRLDDAGAHAVGIGLTRQRWQRGIRGRGGVAGLDERYTAWTASLEARFGVVRAADAWVDLDLRVGRTFDAEVAVDFRDRFDDQTLRLGDQWTARLALPLSFPAGERSRLVVEPGFVRWGFGRSDTEPLRRDGRPVGTVHQPRSEGMNAALRLLWRQSF
jgi:hypothetical protein